MSNEERQPYVAYRADSDEFIVRFQGGPLDGAEICTDVYPDCETFIHRVHGRNYIYRYQRISGKRFEAKLDRYE